MITLKQIEALYWIAQLGGFERAAARLNTTQSAISKRIQELESGLSIELFDRRHRGARLTAKGMELLRHGEEMLKLRNRILETKGVQDAPFRRFRLGVTELTALTWLARLMIDIRAAYPNVILEPEVDNTAALYTKLEDGEVDLIVVPDVYRHPRVTSVILDEVENAWMCSAEMIPSTQAIPLADIAQFTVLAQGELSGSGIVVNQWLHDHGINLRKTLTTNSLMALIGSTIAGMGVAYLPRPCFQGLIDQGLLHIIRTQPSLPKIPYCAIYLNQGDTDFHALVVRLAQFSCDFSQALSLGAVR